MTTKTVQYEQTVTKEETIDLCNDCHREVDEDGMSFVSDRNTQIQSIHLCSECADRLLEDFTPSSIVLAEDWVDQPKFNSQQQREERLRGKVNRTAMKCTLSLILSLVGGFLLLVSSLVFTIPGYVISIYAVLCLIAVLSCWVAADSTHRFLEENF